MHTIGQDWVQKRRKRRRVADDTDSETTQPAATFNPLLGKLVVQQRLIEAVRGIVREKNDRKLLAGAAFVARSSCALFVAVQTLSPLPLGPPWAVLLYVCYYCVASEFSGSDVAALDRRDGLCLRDLRTIVRKMGMAPADDEDDELLMKMARKWERETDEYLEGEVEGVWRVLCEQKVRVAVAAILLPVHRGHLLF